MTTETPESLQKKRQKERLCVANCFSETSAISSVLSAREGVESQPLAQLNGQDENLSARCLWSFMGSRTNKVSDGISRHLICFIMAVAENEESNPGRAICKESIGK